MGISGRFVIAIDGPAGSGKSSVARGVAEELGAADINTGSLYRAVALVALDRGLDLGNGEELAGAAAGLELDERGVLAGGERVSERDLRTPEVSAAASRVSVHPEVRDALVAVQRAAAEKAARVGGAVVEGRDIGTVILPGADLKVFLLAAPGERARRRALQTGREGEVERIQRAIEVRDRQDSEREVSPLRPATDAVVVDTTGLGLDEVVDRIAGLARQRVPGGEESAG